MEKKNWNLNIDEANIAWLGFDRIGAKVNTLNAEALHDLQAHLEGLKKKHELAGIVFYSQKTSGFIAGADIKVLASISRLEDARAFLQLGHSVFDCIAAMPQTTVALIDGFCMGGGLELALACDYRIAVDGEKRSLALPEVKLGLFPGWGGSVRLPRLIGVLPALDLILTGRALTPKLAAKMRIVDACVPRRHAQRAIEHYLEHTPDKTRLPLVQRILKGAPVRPLVANLLRYKTKKIVSKNHYPAPFAVIENWEKYGAEGEEAFTAELDQVTQLAQTATAKNLLRVFQLQDALKQSAKKRKITWQRVHVVGAGIMGGDIAAWCALQGFYVTLQDENVAAIGRSVQRAHSTCTKKLKNPRLVQAAFDRLIADPQGNGIRQADVIIEAIFENLEAKQTLFKKLENEAKATALLATNTSSILLSSIASAMQQPERLVGIHFFNPVARMPLVEVVYDETTDPAVLAEACALVKRIDKLPLCVKSQPGFLVNRILMAYLMEAILMVSEGVPLAAIDKAALEFGMPMGPIELADTVGLDICLSVAENLQAIGGDDIACLREKIDNKHLGRKSGEGFYRYPKGQMKKPKLPKGFQGLEVLQQRLMVRFVNEGMACLREEIVSHSDEIDAGMIFGTGFAPFRGGPMTYVATITLEVFSQQAAQLQQQYGERFKLDEGWAQQASLTQLQLERAEKSLA